MWERDPVTTEEAFNAVIDEAYEIEAFQRRTNGIALSPTAMRKAFVLKHAATILAIVEENADEFRQMIANKRIRAKRQTGG